MTNFKGKVYIYKNQDGKEEVIEKEFDNPQDFYSFTKKNNSFLGSFDGNLSSLGFGDFASLHNYFENLIDKRLGMNYLGNESSDYLEDKNVLVDLDKYENELQKIEYEKQHKEEMLNSLKDTLSRLKDYKKKFEKEGKKDIVKDIDEDIKKTEEEIKKYEK